VTAKLEIRAFMGLTDVFRNRRWSNPKVLDVQGPLSGKDLLDLLDIEAGMVEVIFVNGKAFTPDVAIMTPGDRIALAPPGVPGPYRVLLGFKNMG
jgi:hypothetical protein